MFIMLTFFYLMNTKGQNCRLSVPFLYQWIVNTYTKIDDHSDVLQFNYETEQ